MGPETAGQVQGRPSRAALGEGARSVHTLPVNCLPLGERRRESKAKTRDEATPFLGKVVLEGVEVDPKRCFTEMYASKPALQALK
jgi:hypothetical protein